jgi:hypothetical protein
MHPALLKIINERNLVSVMNNTKWKRLAKAITAERELEPFVRSKDIIDESITGFSLNDWGFTEYNPAIFEWLDIDPIKRNRVGGLVPDIETDITSFILQALAESNVPYSKEGNYFRVWGYYVSGKVPTFL